MDELAMEELAMTYAIDGSEGRMIDYLLCFKTFLMQAAERFHPSESTLANETGKKQEIKNHQKQPPRAEGLKHPWDFEYFKRPEGRKKGPAYWEKALLPKIDTPSSTASTPSRYCTLSTHPLSTHPLSTYPATLSTYPVSLSTYPTTLLYNSALATHPYQHMP